ncbi:hypothetical protein AB0I53_04360 [Saccharopolyspora sp. NPDC050389]|uniref:hypothetical protein n=1 Tax=Saccharopolyspora sp. NPDC050389 TaxID=3155516 RepID=UPI003400D34A
MNARIDLAIIDGLATDPNDQTKNDVQRVRDRSDQFWRHLALLLTPWTSVRLRPCGCHGKPDRG